MKNSDKKLRDYFLRRTYIKKAAGLKLGLINYDNEASIHEIWRHVHWRHNTD